MIDAIYNKDVLRLAADITGIETIKNPDATVSLRSPLCGSSIEISIIVIDDCITEYSQKIKACALGQASASVVAKAVIGKTREEINAARDRTKEMLENGATLPEGDWTPLVALAPAKELKPRHGAILLPFDALLKALEQKYIKR